MILTVIADPLALAVEGDQGTNVGPGMGAFAVFFILAIVLWLLMRNMNARLRRMSYAQKQAEQERGTENAPNTHGFILLLPSRDRGCGRGGGRR